MKSILLLLFSVCLLFTSCETTSDNNNLNKSENESVATQELLRHVVLFNFNDEATEEITTKIEKEFASLKDKISEIHSFEWGINNSPEGLDKGLTHCFLVTFLSEEDRATYLPHPDHQKFVELIGPYVEDVTVVDYWAK